MKFAGDVLHGRTGRAWPHTPTVAVAVVAVVLLGCAGAAAVAAWWLIARQRPAPGDPVAALARNPRIRGADPAAGRPGRALSCAGLWPARTRAVCTRQRPGWRSAG